MIVFRASGVIVTGVLQTVLDVPLSGVGPIRLFGMESRVNAAVGGQGAAHCGVGLGAAGGSGPTTVASLVAQEIRQIFVPSPVERLRFQATCTAGSGTLLDAWLNTSAPTA
jgi:hypothetical protein